VLDLERATRRLVYRVPPGNARTPVVTGWAPGGFVLFALPLLPAISINLDGLALNAVPAVGGTTRRVIPSALTYDEFVEVCGRELVVAAGPGRYTTTGKSLVAARPPSWRVRTIARARSLSWVSPACSPGGRMLAASAGANGRPARFGLERRALWLLSVDGRERRRLTSPPRGSSDELPRWSGDGRSLLFVRSGPTRPNATASGALYLRRLTGGLVGPIAQLGSTSNYYGHYGWGTQTDLAFRRT
jgi:hypothetical protein